MPSDPRTDETKRMPVCPKTGETKRMPACAVPPLKVASRMPFGVGVVINSAVRAFRSV